MGNKLVFNDVRVEDRGVYVCTVETASGSSRASAILEVERREAPKIEIYPSETQTAIKGGSVLFQCRVMAGIPNPEVTWSRADGRSLGPNIEVLSGGGVMRMTEVTEGNEGSYRYL